MADNEVSLRQFMWRIRIELMPGEQPENPVLEEHEIEKSDYQALNFMDTAAVWDPTSAVRCESR